MFHIDDLPEQSIQALRNDSIFTPRRAEFRVRSKGRWRDFIVGGSTQFLFRDKRVGQMGVAIVHHSDPTNVEIKLLQQSSVFRGYMIADYRGGVIFPEDDSCHTVSYSWHDPQKQITTSPKIVDVAKIARCFVDRSSGRMVMVHVSEQQYCSVRFDV